jgi:hypothetical protein
VVLVVDVNLDGDGDVDLSAELGVRREQPARSTADTGSCSVFSTLTCINVPSSSCSRL